MGQASARRSDSDLSPKVMAYCLNSVCPQPRNPSTANFCQACGTQLTLAGRYRLKSLLGQGGFGRTFLAEDLTAEGENPSRCVIKQIYGNSLDEESFHSEAERLRQLGEHPQIPRLLAAIENELGQFLVQEFAPGDNLEQQVEADGPWSETQVRSLLTSLTPVLEYVHSFDIIHRDIKPANIVLKGALRDNSTGSGTQNLPMLVDFGAAKWVRLAPAQTVIGSAGYAAPEQSMGQATFASDIYSLGLTCLHLLTGIHPFSLYSAAEDRWVWQDYLSQPVEPRFAQVLNQMVVRSLQQRYESIDQVALDLQFSQNPLIYAPKQLLTRAQKSIPALRNALQKNVLQSDRTDPSARPIVVTAPQTWQRRYRLTQPIGLTKALAISPQRPIFATAGSDGAVRLWHLPSGQMIHTFHRRRLMGEGHSAEVTALQFHPDGRALYSASSDGTIKEWDSAERCLLNTLSTAGWIPTALAVTPDGIQLISPNSDGQIVLWDIATLMPVVRLSQHQQRVNGIALSTQGNLLASASDDGTVKLWRYQQDRPQLAKTISLSGKGAIAALLHTPEQRRPDQQLVIATSTNEVQLYSLDNQLNSAPPAVFYQSASPITALALSSTGYLAIGSEDRMLTLWRLRTGDCVAKLAHDWGVVAIAFSADSQTLITASADEVISIWQRDSARQV